MRRLFLLVPLAFTPFAIGDDTMPDAVIRGMAILKKAAAVVNRELGKLPGEKAELIGVEPGESQGGVRGQAGSAHVSLRGPGALWVILRWVMSSASASASALRICGSPRSF